MKKNIIILITFILITSSNLFAVPAYPNPVQLKQPDGTNITVILKGDEFFNYYVTMDGYPIVKDERGIFNYARIDKSGKKIDTKVKANNEDARSKTEKEFIYNLTNTPDVSKISAMMRAKRDISSTSKITVPSFFPRTGSPRSLVILVNFSDLNFVTPNPKTAFTEKLNKAGYSENGATGSARDYFGDNSSGVFTPQFDVVGPFTLPQTYSYYGENENGFDMRPAQMIADACKAASDADTDFTTYDTDGDNVVDNVFVYYAGHNEAENAGANRIWPHRWGIYPTAMYGGGNYTGTVASVTFNGKRVEDYACTSELRGNSGTTMAGIGTFTHEFGHVLGLDDMYPTNGNTHHTLSDWCIMDAGAYNNLGRTPPSYNVFERFQLGYLVPALLIDNQNVVLNPLNISNQGLMIAPDDYHNLNPDSPSPSEFFLLENRQQTGWDAYLPGHGMLIYRINFNKTDFENNQPNNDPNKMGVDLIEADNIPSDGTLRGDPFPGNGNVTSYTPYLRNGTELTEKPITMITEQNNLISFRYKGGKDNPILNVSNNFIPFSTEFGSPSEPQSVTIYGEKLVSDIKLSFENEEHFEMKKETDPESMWTKSILLTPLDSVVSPTKILVRYNPASPSYFFTHTNNFMTQSLLSEEMDIRLTAESPTPPTELGVKDITYQSFVANWSAVPGATGYLLAVSRIDSDGDEQPLSDYTDKWITRPHETIYNLLSDAEYTFKVKASSKTSYDNGKITKSSEIFNVQTLAYPFDEELRTVTLKNGVVNVFVPSDVYSEEGTSDEVNVFNITGQKIKSVKVDREIVEISDLPINTVLIIHLGKYRSKTLILAE